MSNDTYELGLNEKEKSTQYVEVVPDSPSEDDSSARNNNFAGGACCAPVTQYGMYRASTEEEKALDKSLNLKLDFLVVGLCAANFLVSELPDSVVHSTS